MSDILEIQNLTQRSMQFLGHLTKRHILRIENDEPPYVGPGERFWLSIYSVSSFIFRMFMYAGIILIIAKKFFIIGILLAIWAFISMIALPQVSKKFIFFYSILLLRITWSCPSSPWSNDHDCCRTFMFHAIPLMDPF